MFVAYHKPKDYRGVGAMEEPKTAGTHLLFTLFPLRKTHKFRPKKREKYPFRQTLLQICR